MQRTILLATACVWALGLSPLPCPLGSSPVQAWSEDDRQDEEEPAASEDEAAETNEPDEQTPSETPTEEPVEDTSKDPQDEEDGERPSPEGPAAPSRPATGAAGAGAGPATGVTGPSMAPSVQVDDALTDGEPGEGEAATDELPEVDEEEGKAGSVAALGAGSAMVSDEEGSKPWTLSFSLGTSLGAAALLSRDGASNLSTVTVAGAGPPVDGQDNDVLLSYNVSAVGLYKLTKLAMGRLDAYTRVGFNGVATDSFTGSELGLTENPRPFFFEDIRLGLLGRSLFVEKKTGIIFGSNLIFRLPTGDLSRATDRVLRTDLSVNATKVFSGVGPGNMILGLSTGFRYDFGPANPTVNLNEFPSLVELTPDPSANGQEAPINVATTDWGVTTSLSARYLMNFGLNFGVTLATLYLRAHDIRTNDPDSLQANLGGTPAEIQSSPFDNGDAGANFLLFSSISVGYAITSHIAVSTGISTLQSGLFQSGSNARALANPFFAVDPEGNATTLFLSANFNY